jgi:hypothetical protein
VPALAENVNPVAAEAVVFGQRAGIPIDAATATGNRAVRAVQHVADRSLGGSFVAERSAQAQAQGLATVGEQLAAKAHPSAVTAEQAGQAVRDATLENVRTHSAEANAAYDTLRAIEADPRYLKTVTVQTTGRTAAGDPVTVPMQQQIALPVDLRRVKAAIRPMDDELKRASELVPPQGDKGRALVALDRLISAGDHAPLSVVDAALGELKSFARSDVPELRTAGQGAAAGAVKHLDAVVRQTAAHAGPDVLKALEAGRTATIAKYGAADVLETFRAEPVKVHGQLTAPQDAAIAQLRAVAKQAPAELPKIGRAFLDDLLGQATTDGGFGKAGTIAAKWEKLGGETKRLLYKDPGYVRDLDNFFRLAKMTAENANPSGTARTLLVATQGGLLWTEPVTGVATSIGTAALSKLLHSPAGVRLLTKGFQIPARNKAVAAAWAADLVKVAPEMGSLVPSFTGDGDAWWQCARS